VTPTTTKPENKVSATNQVVAEPLERLDISTDDDFQEHAYKAGWTDGLPVIEPTPDRVAAMVAAGGLEALDVIGIVPPGKGVATVEAVAANAVMAGCETRHFRVVIAALRALLDPHFNLTGVQATTSPVAPAIMVSGPGVQELGFNAKAGCFGPGNRANAAVGRTIRFILFNIGYGFPGTTDMSTQGSPGKYTFCFAENQDANPWEPHHVERGFAADDTCVTAFQASMVANLLDLGSKTAESAMVSIANAMSTTNHNNTQLAASDLLIVLCPEHATIIGREGLTRDDVKRFLAQNAAVPASRFSEGIMSCVRDFRGDTFKRITHDTIIPVVDDWRDIQIAVAGGDGSNSAFIPGWGNGGSTCAKVI
jgi:hypothetical protein